MANGDGGELILRLNFRTLSLEHDAPPSDPST